MLLNDKEIRAYCDQKAYEKWLDECTPQYRNFLYDNIQFPMLDPFSEAVSGDGVVSWGLSTGGYDLRLADELWVCKNTHGEVVDVRRMKEPGYCEKIYDRILVSPHYDLPSHSYILGRSLERIQMPRHIMGRCYGKSTLARAGILINVTPLEAGWTGFLTIEIANTSPSPVRLYTSQGIAQLQFETMTGLPEKDYEAKGGKYMNQTGVTPGFVK